MIISTSILRNSVENYNKYQKLKENFSTSNSISAGISAGFVTLSLTLAVLFFALELMVMFYAIIRAVNCTTTTQGRIIHIVIAITFTLPYMLFSIFFGKCSFDVY